MPPSGDKLGGVRLLILLNPGHTSRNYLIGIVRAAQRLGVFAGAVELEPLWRELEAPGANSAAARAAAAKQMAELCRTQRVTHVLGYTHNGVLDFGVRADPAARAGADPAAPIGLFTALGVRHILLWTDHPHWAGRGVAMAPGISAILAHESHLHIVKSHAAAEELSVIPGWERVAALTMGEDYEAMIPARDVSRVHDVVLIQSDAAPVHEALARFLGEADPDPRAMMEAMRGPTIAYARLTLENMTRETGAAAEPTPIGACEALAAALIERRLDAPLPSWWRTAAPIRAAHGEAARWLESDLRRWVSFTAALNTLVNWRRSFWPAWLVRRGVSVGLYGSPAHAACAAAPGATTPAPGAQAWISYTRQPSVYAAGRVALNINAGHDEEGLTHKPFQIAAAGAACAHHDTIGLAGAFEPGVEVAPFVRGSELLETVRRLADDERARTEMGEAMRARALRDHTWDHFLVRALAVDAGAPECDKGLEMRVEG